MRLGLLSDAHGNLEAFRRALDVLAGEGAESIHFLGDAVGYFPGDAVVSEIRLRGIAAVRGNHEEMLLKGTSPLEREHIYRLRQTAHGMAADNRVEMERWPHSRTLESPFGPLWLIHGSPRDPTYGYVYPDTDLEGMSIAPHAAVFMGNSHRPFVRRMAGALFINVGSCGLPRDSGDLGAACLFDDVTGAARILRFSIVEETREALLRCGPVAPDVEAVFARRAPIDAH
jgi:predicted phosphodiesterase